jgi:hypothetical protein
MTPRFPAQRRAAEEFARAVDGPAGAIGEHAGEYAGLVRTVTLLRQQPRPVPRADFVADLRERLLAAADEALVPTTAPAVPARPSSRRRRAIGWRERHLGAAVAGLVMVGSTAGLAAAAQGSLPGETLYPLKRGIEHVEVTMSTNDAAKGKELLSQASTRLSEVRELVRGDHDARSVALIGETLQDFRSSADRGSGLLFKTYQGSSNSDDIADVRAFTTGTMETLRALAGQSPSTASDDFSKAGETVADIDQQARVLCIACSDAAPVTLPQALVNLTSARALEQLVSLPARQAEKAAALARAAEKQADATPQLGAPSGSASPGTGSTGGPLGTIGTGKGLGGSLPAAGSHPLRDLVAGLTTKVPLVGTVTQGLGDDLTGLTDPLGNTVEGVTQSLNGLLGGANKGPSPTPQP